MSATDARVPSKESHSGSSDRVLLTGFKARPIVVSPSAESQELQDKIARLGRSSCSGNSREPWLSPSPRCRRHRAARAQDQKGTLVFAVELLGAQTLDPDPRRPAGQRDLPGGDVRFAGRLRSREGRRRARRRRTLGTLARRPDLDLLIRPGQNFHNGDKLTAHDVKFSLERQMGPGSLAAAAASMRRTIKSIEVVDDLTVKVNTTSPQIGLPASLSRAVAPEGAIMPKAYIEKVGEEEFRKKPIGSGPWKFVRNVPGDRIEFTAVANALARHAALQGPARPAGAGGEHARRHGAHRRGGDRLDRPRDHAQRLARRAGGAGGAGHDAGDLPVLGHLQAGG